MNELQQNLESAPNPANADEKYEGLRRQISLLFAGLIVTSFTLTAYLGLQARRVSLDLLAVKPRANEMVRLFKQDDAAVQSVFAKLTDFARTHPDFQKQILSKYRLNTNAPAAAVKK